ncbi:hypothetical protein LJC48_07550, partial [Desulfovibrio sp. OttesenSCG-928-C06]|nr:hypothetical protein [Desulfovibrio sp. OttesenSCG-928-C06]
MNESDAPNSGLLTITEAEAGVKLLRFLERRLGLPRPSLFRLLRTGQVRVNKGRCKPDRVLLAGDEVRLPPQYAGLLGVTSAVVLPGSPDMAGADQARSGQKRSDRDKPAQDGPVHGGSNQARQDGLDQRKASPVRPSPAGLTPASPVANKSALTQPVSGPDAEPGSRERGSACGRQGNTENEQLSNPAAGRDFGLNILKLEKHYLVLDKPAGLPVQPGSGHSDSLSGRLKEFSAHC